ncbi:MAG: hypothetical protein R3C19_19500 [Planctomycetaceae bacterium]
MSSELRTDLLTGRQVIVAPGRSDRPGAIAVDPPLAAENDPFLESNERETPQETLALRTTDSQPNHAGWLLRVVPNRYPMVSRIADAMPHAGSESNAPADTIAGAHEVVIECPDGRSRLTELTIAEISRILLAWQKRVHFLEAQAGTEVVSVFRNQGFSAGASLLHSHSQIVATNCVPPLLEERIRRAEEHRLTTGDELVEQLLQREREFGQRIVRYGRDMAVFCPFASRANLHVRWLPTEKSKLQFQTLNTCDLLDLAASLFSVARAIDDLAERASLNLVLSLPPTRSRDAFRWMLDLLPRTSRIAGFELMTDVDIITMPPETAASLLRENITWQPAPDEQASLFPSGYQWRP